MVWAREKVKIGITSTCWTNDDFAGIGEHIPFEQCVSEMALAGFEGCSVGHKFPEDPDQLVEALRLRGLRVSEPWCGLHFAEEGRKQATLDEFLRVAAWMKRLGGTVVVVAELGRAVHQSRTTPVFENPVFSDADFDRVAAGIRECADIAGDHDLRICYHPHVGTGVQSRGDVEKLLERVDPSEMSLLLDTAHLALAGEDPTSFCRDYVARIKHVHLKDLRRGVADRVRASQLTFEEAIRAGVFTVPSDGDLDFDGIFDILGRVNYEGWLVVEAEQDPLRAPPLRMAFKAREYVETQVGF